MPRTRVPLVVIVRGMYQYRSSSNINDPVGPVPLVVAVSGLHAFQKQPNMCAMNIRITNIFKPFLMLRGGEVERLEGADRVRRDTPRIWLVVLILIEAIWMR